MITLDGEILVLDRTQDEEGGILPLLHTGKGKPAEWYIDLGIEAKDVLYWLVDAEILDEPFRIRYIASNGQQAETNAQIEELISGPEGDLCRLRGLGAPPPAFLADEPKAI